MITDLPFTYIWLIKQSLRKRKVESILELGCGKGDLANWINQDKFYQITGTDIFEPYLKICQKNGLYKKLLKQDLNKKLLFKKKSFDAVFMLQTVEHLNKKNGQSLLDQLENIAKKIIVISTPQGECLQEEYDDNKYQQHLSSWTAKDFEDRGYQVFGVGLRAVYGSYSHIKERFSLLRLPLYAVSFLLNPVANKCPQIACQMVAIKKLR